MTVLYTFRPTIDGWTGTYTNRADRCEFTDSYTTRVWMPDAIGVYPYGYYYKTATGLGTIWRITGSFSISLLPDDDVTSILTIGHTKTAPANPALAPFEFFLAVYSDGTFCWARPGGDISVKGISAGVLYDIEIIFTYGEATRLYINNELWLETTDAYISTPEWMVYSLLTVGIPDWVDNDIPYDVNVHWENLVWTMDDGVELGHVYLHGVTEV